MATAALRVLKDLAKKKINGANSTDYHNSETGISQWEQPETKGRCALP